MKATTIRPIQKILVANRGEIALRVMKTAREMGIKTVAVYSDADKQAVFARYADEAIRIGPAPSSESYLIGANIIKAAQSVGPMPFIPDMAFLSENAAFQMLSVTAGLTFIGPKPRPLRPWGPNSPPKKP